MKQHIYCLLLIATFVYISCKEEEERAGFAITSGHAQEDDGEQTIIINLGTKTTSQITITYIVGGTASLDGDYKVLSNTSYFSTSSFSLTVPEGQSTATLNFELIDDNHVERTPETIFFQITGISDSDINASIGNDLYRFTIEDNDLPPDDGLQIDLSWDLGTGLTINSANFDLYLARGVRLDEDGVITDMELVDNFSSTNSKGFESLIAESTIADEDYYVIIRFVQGSSNANVFLHMSQGDEYGVASGRISTDYVGRDFYYGPISKNGNIFSFR